MSSDMRIDIFAKTEYGHIALSKMGNVHKDFRLYEVGWIGKPNMRRCMKVKGAVFRDATRGKNKGKMCIIVKGSERVAYVTREELGVDKAQDDTGHNDRL